MRRQQVTRVVLAGLCLAVCGGILGAAGLNPASLPDPTPLSQDDMASTCGATATPCKQLKEEACEKVSAKPCTQQPCTVRKGPAGQVNWSSECPATAKEERQDNQTYNKQIDVPPGDGGFTKYIQQAAPSNWTNCVSEAACLDAGKAQVGKHFCAKIGTTYYCQAAPVTATWTVTKKHEVWLPNGAACTVPKAKADSE